MMLMLYYFLIFFTRAYMYVVRTGFKNEFLQHMFYKEVDISTPALIKRLLNCLTVHL